METKTLKISNPKVKSFYDELLYHMQKQYKDVVSLEEAHINKNGKVFSAQWRDSKGVINFCGGWALDCVKLIRFKN